MLRTLDGYILRSFFVNYLISLAAMMGLYVVLDLFFNLDEFIKSDITLWRLLRNLASFYGYNLLLFFLQLSGVITLFAAACTLARMSRANELTAVLAAGTSLYRVAAPIILAGIALNVLYVIDQEVIIPRVAHKLARPHGDVEGRQAYRIVFEKDRNGALLSTARFVPYEQRLGELIVVLRDGQRALSGVILADGATWDPQAGAWRLERGLQYTPADSASATGDAAPLRVPVDLYPTQLSPEALVLRQAKQWIRFLSLGQLNELAAHHIADLREIDFIRHGRFAMPIANVLFLLLGLPFFLDRVPGSIVRQAGLCLLNCGLCFVAVFATQNLLQPSQSPALVAWVPIMVFAPMAVIYMDGVRT